MVNIKERIVMNIFKVTWIILKLCLGTSLLYGLFLFFMPVQKNIPSFIETTNTLNPLWSKLDQLNQETLIIFDIDKVLLTGPNSYDRGTKEQRRPIKHILKSIVCEYKNYAALERKRMLVDAHTPRLIYELQHKSIPVMALTMCPSGPYEQIAQLKDIRLNELATFDLNFSTTFAQHNNLILAHITHKKAHPIFKDGVLFSCGCDKGKTLATFLQEIHWYPQQIIFIDNKLSNIRSVQSTLKKLKIPFYGIHYTAAQTIPGTFDEKLVKFQIQYLRTHQKLLNDDEAKNKLANESLN